MKIETFWRYKTSLTTWRRIKQYCFRIVADNGLTIAQSEGYYNKTDRDSIIRKMRVQMRDAKIVEIEQ